MMTWCRRIVGVITTIVVLSLIFCGASSIISVQGERDDEIVQSDVFQSDVGAVEEWKVEQRRQSNGIASNGDTTNDGRGGAFHLPVKKIRDLSNAVIHMNVPVPVWGNYCGPRYSGPGDPIDYLDTACMHHDECYVDTVRADRDSTDEQNYCDKRLIEEIDASYDNMDDLERSTSTLLRVFFSAKTLPDSAYADGHDAGTD